MHDLIPVFPDRLHLHVREIIQKALLCPCCGAGNAKLVGMSECKARPHYVIACTVCKHRGPFGKNLQDAVKKWNAKPWEPFAFLGKWLRP